MDRAALIAAMQAAAEAVAKPRRVTVPKWGTVYVRELTVAEVDEQQDAPDDDKKTRLARAACRVLCDETGQRLFDAGKPEDVALLAAQPWSLLRKVLAEGDEKPAAEAAEGNA